MHVLYSDADEARRQTHNYVRRCYAHRDAEGFMGHDILLTYLEWEPTEGIHPVTLVNPKGERLNAYLFVTNDESKMMCRGLCVFADDLEGIADGIKLLT